MSGITVAFIVLSAVVAVFVRRTQKDKCLKDFSSDMITLEKINASTVWGSLNVENTGLEFVYAEKHKDEDGHDETSYILYKYEYPNALALIRYHDQLSDAGKKSRKKS